MIRYNILLPENFLYFVKLEAAIPNINLNQNHENLISDALKDFHPIINISNEKEDHSCEGEALIKIRCCYDYQMYMSNKDKIEKIWETLRQTLPEDGLIEGINSEEINLKLEQHPKITIEQVESYAQKISSLISNKFWFESKREDLFKIEESGDNYVLSYKDSGLGFMFPSINSNNSITYSKIEYGICGSGIFSGLESDIVITIPKTCIEEDLQKFQDSLSSAINPKSTISGMKSEILNEQQKQLSIHPNCPFFFIILFQNLAQYL